MHRDVQELLTALGIPEFEYTEVADAERWQGGGQRWPVLASINRALIERTVSQVPPTSPLSYQRLHAAHCIGVASGHGGAGRSTVAANLTAALAQAGRRAVALDLDPLGTLGLHFGLDPQEPTGVFQTSISQAAVASWMARFRGGASVLPFGKLAAGLQTGLEATLVRDPFWLRKRLQMVVPGDCEFVVLDLPVASHPLFRAAAGLVDTMLAVVTTEPPAYAALPRLEAMLDDCFPAGGSRRVRYLLNKVDARRDFDRALVASLRGTRPDQTLSFGLHWDSSVPIALANRRLLLQEAADSQVAVELSALAEWVGGVAAATAKVPERSIALVS